jgi:hypothetical protein
MKKFGIIASLAAIALLIWGRQGRASVTFKPVLMPFTVSMDTKGRVSLLTDSVVMTPIGDFTIGSVVPVRLADDEMLVTVRDQKRRRDIAYRMRRGDNVQLLSGAATVQRVEGGLLILLSRGRSASFGTRESSVPLASETPSIAQEARVVGMRANLAENEASSPEIQSAERDHVLPLPAALEANSAAARFIRRVELPRGFTIVLKLGDEFRSDRSFVGSQAEAAVHVGLPVNDGSTALAGAALQLRISAVNLPSTPQQRGDVAFTGVSLRMRNQDVLLPCATAAISTEPVEHRVSAADTKKVVVGSLIGGALGGILRGRKGLAEGAATGGAAGAVAAAATVERWFMLRSGSEFTCQLLANASFPLE